MTTALPPMPQPTPGDPFPTPWPAGPTYSRPLLTDVQIELLQMVADGLGHDQIGRRLGISRSATSTRLDRIYSRIGAINAPNAVAIAIRAGLLPTPTLARRGHSAMRPTVATGGAR